MRHRLLALLLTTTYVAASSAQTDSQSSQPPTQDFATAKAQMEARLQQQLACVQAATTLDALHACMPRPPGGRMGPPPSQR
jgi:hypothetical protein